jgi:hypothetical protein
MAEDGRTPQTSGRPHVWTFWATILAAVFAAGITASVNLKISNKAAAEDVAALTKQVQQLGHR